MSLAGELVCPGEGEYVQERVGMSRGRWVCPRGGYVPGVGIPRVRISRRRWVCPHPTGMLSFLTMNLFSHSLDRKFWLNEQKMFFADKHYKTIYGQVRSACFSCREEDIKIILWNSKTALSQIYFIVKVVRFYRCNTVCCRLRVVDNIILKISHLPWDLFLQKIYVWSKQATLTFCC